MLAIYAVVGFGLAPNRAGPVCCDAPATAIGYPQSQSGATFCRHGWPGPPPRQKARRDRNAIANALLYVAFGRTMGLLRTAYALRNGVKQSEMGRRQRR